ncbi:twitching motility protein PilT [Ignicoccus pacificus DSM 13166]|uniref:Twitching motility protein PilT n=1 Tax=Ignicoccus pacificus DSM 13166 TaxID=940294 RepID=A0A977K9W0_9CREN|nr:twitching motility protein PilT [Ignicoccus pacificus DSM 13166]
MDVADSSALISLFLREPGWKDLKEHLSFVTTIDLSLKEIYNAIWKAHKLRGSLKEEQMWMLTKLVKEYFDCCVVIEDQRPLLDDALRIATKYGLTIYNSLFVVLALTKDLPLVSLDAKQRRVARMLGVEVLP